MRQLSYRLFIFLGVLALIFMFASPDRHETVETVEVSAPVQSLLETMVTYHTHQVILDFVEDRDTLMGETDQEHPYVSEYPGLMWSELVSRDARVHALYSKDIVSLDSSTQFKVGKTQDRPLYIKENREGFEFNGAVVLMVQFDTYRLMVDVHYQDVKLSRQAFDRKITGELFYRLRFLDEEQSSVVQAATGSVDFSREWIRVNDQEYSFAEFNKVALNLHSAVKI